MAEMFVHVIRGRLQLPPHQQQRPQQSRFTAGRSTADVSLALRLLSELHREFSKPLQSACSLRGQKGCVRLSGLRGRGRERERERERYYMFSVIRFRIFFLRTMKRNYA